MHHTVVTILRTTIKASPPQNVEDVNNLVEYALAAAMHSSSATVSTKLKATQVVMVIKDFITIILVFGLHIHTDPKNLTFDNLNMQQVLR